MAIPVTAQSTREEDEPAPPPREEVDACYGLLIMSRSMVAPAKSQSPQLSCHYQPQYHQQHPAQHSPPRPQSYYDHSPWDLFTDVTWGLPPLSPLGRVGSMILDHPGGNFGPYPLTGVTFVMFDVRGYASEYAPVFVTAVHERDPFRNPCASHAADIQSGEGVLLSNLLSARVCGHRTVGQRCRFHYDGNTYLVADNALDFVWVPSDGFHRTRQPYPSDACADLEGHGFRNAYEYYSCRFLEYMEEYFRGDEKEQEHECSKHHAHGDFATMMTSSSSSSSSSSASLSPLSPSSQSEPPSLHGPACSCEFHSS